MGLPWASPSIFWGQMPFVGLLWVPPSLLQGADALTVTVLGCPIPLGVQLPSPWVSGGSGMLLAGVGAGMVGTLVLFTPNLPLKKKDD